MIDQSTRDEQIEHHIEALRTLLRDDPTVNVSINPRRRQVAIEELERRLSSPDDLVAVLAAQHLLEATKPVAQTYKRCINKVKKTTQSVEI
jgi:hypothetical protein